jgi:threonine aldolase
MPWRCEANEIFVVLPRSADAALRAGGAIYYPWESRDFGPDCEPPARNKVFVRLVTSFATKPRDIQNFLAIASGAGR